MGLFQKKTTIYSSNLPSYNLHFKEVILIVGLGNPGSEYQHTRHNVGFFLVDELAKQFEASDFKTKKEWDCLITDVIVDNRKVIIAKPQTFMNESGRSVMAIANFYKILPENIVVIHDELDINFGQIRINLGGSSAGHNGLKSIINTVGQNFYRLRVGIGPKQPEKIDSADFVLAKFSDEEQKFGKAMSKEVIALINEHLVKNLDNQTRYFII